jgi:hypothetical protein
MVKMIVSISGTHLLLQSLAIQFRAYNEASVVGWLAKSPFCRENTDNLEDNTMPTPKYIKPGTKVGLKLTAAKRKIILEDIICLDDNYLQIVRDTPAEQPVQLTLDDWDDLGGYIATAANHMDDKRLEKKLDTIFDKIQKILDTHTDEEPQKTFKIEDARGPKTTDRTH